MKMSSKKSFCFHAGNVDQFERYDAAGMLGELQKLVDDEELDVETLPKVENKNIIMINQTFDSFF